MALTGQTCRMVRCLICLGLFGFMTSGGVAQTVYFPKGALAAQPQPDQFKSEWYSHQLIALEEPSLLEASRSSVEQYRFLWVRTFHHPVVIRLVVNADGSGTLTEKIASGQGGYDPGKLDHNVLRPITAKEVGSYLSMIRKAKFWSLPTYPPPSSMIGCDGSEWIIEGVKGGEYHVVNRWTPGKGPVFELGMAMLGLTSIKVPKNEMY